MKKFMNAQSNMLTVFSAEDYPPPSQEVSWV